MNLVVLGPHVFIRPDALPEMTSDGLLHLVHDRQQVTLTGTVVAVGDGPEFISSAVRAALDEAIERVNNKYVTVALNEIREQFKPEHIVSIGERVVFSPERGEELFFEQELLICLKEDDILAVVE